MTALRRDVVVYRGLADRMRLPPTPFMLPFMGPAAVDLADRHASDAADWRSFRECVTRFYPSLPVWTPTTATDGQVLSSVVERCAYEALRPCLPALMTLTVHPIIAPSRKWVADFSLANGQARAIRIEVAGLLASDWQPRNPREASYRVDLEAKLAAYDKAGLPRPTIIHVDEICDPPLLWAAIDKVIARAEGLSA
jgi:hypothetical protein